MSLRKSLDKLKEVIHAAKPPSTIPMPPWPENCCLYFKDIGTTNPTIHLFCNGEIVQQMPYNYTAPKNAVSCDSVPVYA